LLLDIHRQQWDAELLRLFRIPFALLPEVLDSSQVYGTTAAGIFDKPIPIAGIAGDQQAALFGQACFESGTAKSTYGTGCFMLLNTGEKAVLSSNRLLTTVAYRLGGRTTYALEGSIFVAGAAIKWLRDGLKLITHASETDALASSISNNQGVYMVPAFVGLGAPHWMPNARGLICGLTLDVTGAQLARAALESVAFQTLDLCDAMARDGASRVQAIRVDGGMAANNWFCQFLADMLNASVERPRELETTALGAAFLAGLATGVWPDLKAISATWSRSAEFTPRIPESARTLLTEGWRLAVRRTLLE
jgi:glycerol kinase